MDVSLFYFANDSTEHSADRYRLLLEGARFADRNGFAAVWTPERHFHPFGGLYPNPSVTSAAIATITERVKIRAGSVVAPLHNPLRIAEEWAVVDNLSNGRVGVSFASGWHAIDFAFSPANYKDRRELMDKFVGQVRSLWRGEKLDVLDGHGNSQQVGIFPMPIQQEIPVWLTSSSHIETFRKAGRLGTGILTHLLGQNPDQLATKIAAYRSAIAERDADDGWPGHVVLMVHTCLGLREDETKELVRGPMCDYFRSSLGLLLGSQVDGGPPIDPATLTPADVDALVTHAFDRHYNDGGLLGTVDKVGKLVDRFRAMGVDELACLIDFGVPTAAVLSNLGNLNALREMSESTMAVS